ncbi:restriction endonuclease subunit S [Vibrio parahaemolyticus]
MVPNGWEKHPVGKLCKSIVPGRNKPKVFDGDIPWVTTPEILGKYIPSKIQKNFISQYVAKECGAKIVPKGAVVIAAVGELGLTAIATEEIILNQQLHAFVCPNDLDNEYLAYFLSTQKPYMDTVASKTTIPYMNKTNCESIPILLPPLPEQQKIAKILSTWDKSIATTEKLIATSQQQKKALMQQLLTGEKRLVNPDTGKVFEGDWEDICLSDIASIMTDYVANGSFQSLRENVVVKDSIDYALYVRLVDLRAGLGHSSQKYVDKTSYEYLKKSSLSGGELLMANIGANVGEVWRMPNVGFPATLAPNMLMTKFKKNADSHYVYYFLASKLGQNRISVVIAGSGHPKINKTELKQVKVLLPQLSEQQKITSVLVAADKEIELLQAKLAHLKDEKKALMQQLLTGKRRVKVEAMEMA